MRELAPWVVRRRASDGGELWLGPRWTVVHVAAPATVSALEREAYDSLCDADFLIEASVSDPTERAFLEDTERFDGLIVCGDYPVEGDALREALAELSQRWLLVRDLESAGRAARACAHRPAVVWVRATEPAHPGEHLAELLDACDVVWMGESAEGLHVGPCLRDLDDAHAYSEATWTWADATAVVDLGFRDEVSLSLLSWLRRDPRRVGRALLATLAAERLDCHVVGDGRRVTLWTALRRHAVEGAAFRAQQAWSKGALRELVLWEDADTGVNLGTCRTPAGAVEFLETNAGKGPDVAGATNSTIGEAVERLAAFLGGERANHQTVTDSAVSEYALADFHPFGEDYERYRAAGEPPLASLLVRDERNGTAALVPECLVPFPYRAKPGSHRGTRSDTAGLAAHPIREQAIVNGVREILERDNFYPAFLHQRPGVILDLSRADWLDSPARRALAGLEAAHARVWLLVYPQAATSPLRIAHAFIADPRGFVSRGSGSWASWAGAVSGALFEAVQLRAEHERFLACPEARLDDNATAYGAWASPQIVRELTSYLDAQPREVVDDDPRAKQAWVERSETGAPFPRSPSRRSKQWPRATPGRKGRPLGRTAGLELDQWPRDRRSELSVSQLYGELLESFTRQGRALLVAELPSPIADWTAVRVLIPKATTHQAASRSRGGERLENATFLYGVPT